MSEFVFSEIHSTWFMFTIISVSFSKLQTKKRAKRVRLEDDLVLQIF